MKNAFFYTTAIGKIGIAENGGAITNVFFGDTVAPEAFEEKETPLICKTIFQLNEYLGGTRRAFDLPLAPIGTEFQLLVWHALLKIPYGETKNYKQIAEQIGRPKAYRAVGMANRSNPISILIPCHRVIGSNGALTGFAGGLDLKKHLIDLENKKE